MSRTRSCKAIRIAAILRERIAGGVPDSSFASARELGREFGVSRRTADRAVRLLADEGLLTRIPGAGTYLAGVKRLPRIICLQPGSAFSSLPSGSYGRYCWNLLSEELKHYRCECTFICVDDLYKRHFSTNLWKKYDGLLAHSVYSDIHSRQLIAEFPGPVAWVGPLFPLLPSGSQAIPDYMPALLKLLHLARREGMQYCHFCMHNRHFEALYREAADLSGFTKEVCRYHFLEKISLQNATALGMTLDADLRKTVFFCDSDELASGLYLAFRKRGVRVGDFQIVGSGNMESLGYRLLGDEAHLTTIAIDRKALVRAVLECFFKQIDSGSGNSLILRVPAQVVFRDSAFSGTGRKTGARQRKKSDIIA